MGWGRGGVSSRPEAGGVCAIGGNEQLHGSCAAHELGSFDRADGGRRPSLPLPAMARGGSVTPGGVRERKYGREGTHRQYVVGQTAAR